jgi:hypothetical protein
MTGCNGTDVCDEVTGQCAPRPEGGPDGGAVTSADAGGPGGRDAGATSAGDGGRPGRADAAAVRATGGGCDCQLGGPPSGFAPLTLAVAAMLVGPMLRRRRRGRRGP